jgi:hypothetical protein
VAAWISDGAKHLSKRFFQLRETREEWKRRNPELLRLSRLELAWTLGRSASGILSRYDFEDDEQYNYGPEGLTDRSTKYLDHRTLSEMSEER